jgi:hypothetical protein
VREKEAWPHDCIVLSYTWGTFLATVPVLCGGSFVGRAYQLDQHKRIRRVYGYAGEDNEEDWMGYANGFPGVSLIVFEFQVHD